MTFISNRKFSYRFSSTILWGNVSSQTETDLFNLLALDSYMFIMLSHWRRSRGARGGEAPKSKIRGAVPTQNNGGAEPLHYYPRGI